MVVQIETFVSVPAREGSCISCFGNKAADPVTGPCKCGGGSVDQTHHFERTNENCKLIWNVQMPGTLGMVGGVVRLVVIFQPVKITQDLMLITVDPNVKHMELV